MIPLDQLVRPLSRDEVKATIYAMLGKLGLPTTSWQPGAPTRTLIAVVAVLYAGFTVVMSALVRAMFLDSAEGLGLTLLARLVYGVERIPATYATTELTIVNSKGGLYEFDPGDFQVKNSATGATFFNTARIIINPLATVTIDIQAHVAGAGGTSAAGEIDTLIVDGNGLSVTNATAAIGQSAQTDASLREDCRLSLGALSPNGPRAAYVWGARRAKRADGSYVAVNRVRVLPPPGDGSLQVYVAGPAGAVTDDDLAVVDANIQGNVVPIATGPVVVSKATAHPIAVTATVYVVPGTTAVDARVKAALRDYLATIDIGGTALPAQARKVYRAEILAAIKSALAGAVIHVDLTAPSADVTIGNTEVATLNEGGSSITPQEVA